MVGGGLIVLGSLSLGEGWRLYGLRTQMVAGAVVGDDTFPLIVGASMVALGVLAAFVTAPATLRVVFPYGEPRGRMLVTGALLVVYWLVLPYAGYTASTALVSIGLFGAMGGYRWPISVLLGAATTGLLYLMFRVWLVEPLPTGWLGF
ncbi:MAG: hypothetical protein A3E31_01245 [Candidatus Rokubacteria bacterium RIFCSPHIGHO2_12_FULL_73_22]|nr:MAG: hypothetical protein A3D33_01205 [Candidatus Rokubacteria bacterium RIFCSPHIGHO2_02_FULL_73_26]OGL03872.1 MAG: hypothetical protein A3E31_01245 [Candidatus Rokubacteria bacterium RIFCSPHIGHO2_12_FULL_73_22]OGL10975.1 MAG: hypothetical protein A3I14_01950 [Candidatus Rokubacteria bacterium RIFCSPLOWO2_02_FULL_73_56]